MSQTPFKYAIWEVGTGFSAGRGGRSDFHPQKSGGSMGIRLKNGVDLGVAENAQKP